MNLPPEVQRTIRRIDKKIEELEETKQRLLAAFSAPSITAKTKAKSQPSQIRPENVAAVSGAIATINAIIQQPNSRERLVAFLRANGPATRSEIVEGASVPNGSISWLMQKLSIVHKREDGKYELVREN